MAATKKNTTVKAAKTIKADGANDATKSVEKAIEVSQEQVDAAVKASDDAFKAYEDVVSYSKDNFDALLNANTVFTKGLQALNQEITSIFQSNLEVNTAAGKKLLTCNTVQDVVALQNDLIKSSYASAIDQSKKITDMSVKVTDDTTAPLSKRVNVTVETFSKSLAA